MEINISVLVGSLALLAAAFLAGYFLGETAEHQRAKKIIGGKNGQGTDGSLL